MAKGKARAAQPKRPPANRTREVKFTLELSKEEHADFSARAAAEGLALAVWMRLTLRRAGRS